MKIAMLGSGFIGRFYADSLQGYRSKDKIVSIYSRRQESAQKFGEDYKVGHVTTTMEEAIAHPDVEVVCIALPNNIHEEADVVGESARRKFDRGWLRCDDEIHLIRRHDADFGTMVPFSAPMIDHREFDQ